MALGIGIVGLPNVGKSTLFNALLGTAQAAAANYPFCTIEPNLGVVPVPDQRLDALSALFGPEKTTPTTLEFIDIAGLVAGASKGEGLGNQFLATIREVDAIAHVLRCFVDGDVIHVAGKVDPASDRDVVETELMLKDLESVEKRRERTVKNTKAAGKAGELARAELVHLDELKAGLNAGIPARRQQLSEDGRALARELSLLTAKPVLYIANVDESQLGKADDPNVAKVKALADAEGAPMVVISGKVEAELVELAPAERAEFLAQPRARGAGAQPAGARRLRPAPPHHLLHLRRRRVPRLDGPPRRHRAQGGRRHPHRLREGLHQGGGDPRRGPARAEDRGGLPREGEAADRGARVRGAGRRRHALPVQRLIPTQSIHDAPGRVMTNPSAADSRGISRSVRDARWLLLASSKPRRSGQSERLPRWRSYAPERGRPARSTRLRRALSPEACPRGRSGLRLRESRAG